MTHWYEGFGEFDEMPEEYPEVIPDEYLKEQDPQLIDSLEMDIPDVWWAESIKDIENPQIRQKEIKAAEKILEKQKTLDEKLESGEFSQSRYDHENLVKLGRQKANFSARCDFESDGLTYDHLGDHYDLLLAEVGGEPKAAKMKDQLKESIDRLGPEASKDLADQMLEDGKISKNTHDTISRQVRLNGK